MQKEDVFKNHLQKLANQAGRLSDSDMRALLSCYRLDRQRLWVVEPLIFLVWTSLSEKDDCHDTTFRSRRGQQSMVDHSESKAVTANDRAAWNAKEHLGSVVKLRRWQPASYRALCVLIAIDANRLLAFRQNVRPEEGSVPTGPTTGTLQSDFLPFLQRKVRRILALMHLSKHQWRFWDP